MATTLTSALPTASEHIAPLTPDESATIFERATRRYLKMSPKEFLANMESGYFQDHPELERRLDSVLFYLPLLKR